MTGKRHLTALTGLLLSLILVACSENTPTALPTTTSATTTSTTAAVATAPTTLPSTGAASTTTATANSDLIEPRAGSWKTWLLSSGSQLRLPAPPDNTASQAEIKQLKDMVGQRDATALDMIAYWDTGGPSYRWNQIASDEILKNNLIGNLAARDMALLNTAIYDGLIAAWDTKYTYNRLRPSQLDNSLSTVIPNPKSPAYPSEFAVAAGAAATVLSYIFPDDAASFAKQADDAAKSRLLAGVDYPSDVSTGLDLGRTVGTMAVTKGKADGSDAKWTGSVPTEPGKWNGTNPIFPVGATLKTWVLSTPNEFRPGPPPAYDSAQEQADLAEIKDFQAKRTPKINADAFFWEHGAAGTRSQYYWSTLINRLVLEYHLDTNPVREARAYALYNITYDDVIIACWDAKYTYWAIRPFMLDKGVQPLFTTPNHPSYPAAHATVDTAMADTLGYLFPRDAQKLKDLSIQAGLSRIWAGIHFRTDVKVGTTLGDNVAQKIVAWANADGSK